MIGFSCNSIHDSETKLVRRKIFPHKRYFLFKKERYDKSWLESGAFSIVSKDDLFNSSTGFKTSEVVSAVVPEWERKDILNENSETKVLFIEDKKT